MCHHSLLKLMMKNEYISVSCRNIPKFSYFRIAIVRSKNHVNIFHVLDINCVSMFEISLEKPDFSQPLQLQFIQFNDSRISVNIFNS